MTQHFTEITTELRKKNDRFRRNQWKNHIELHTTVSLTAFEY